VIQSALLRLALKFRTCLFSAAAVFLLVFVADFARINVQAQSSNLSGAWVLRLVESKEYRTITFRVVNKRVTGSYVGKDGQPTTLDNVTYVNGTLKFHIARVGSLELKESNGMWRGNLQSEVNKQRTYDVALTRPSSLR